MSKTLSSPGGLVLKTVRGVLLDETFNLFPWWGCPVRKALLFLNSGKVLKKIITQIITTTTTTNPLWFSHCYTVSQSNIFLVNAFRGCCLWWWNWYLFFSFSLCNSDRISLGNFTSKGELTTIYFLSWNP